MAELKIIDETNLTTQERIMRLARQIEERDAELFARVREIAERLDGMGRGIEKGDVKEAVQEIFAVERKRFDMAKFLKSMFKNGYDELKRLLGE